MNISDVLPWFAEAVGLSTSPEKRLCVRMSDIPSEGPHRHILARRRLFLFIRRAMRQTEPPAAAETQRPCFDGSTLTFTPEKKVDLRRWLVNIIANRAVQILDGANNG